MKRQAKRPPRSDGDFRALAEAVRQACIDAALAGYEDAALAGVCHEGAWEAAISAIRGEPLEELVARAVGKKG